MAHLACSQSPIGYKQLNAFQRWNINILRKQIAKIKGWRKYHERHVKNLSFMQSRISFRPLIQIVRRALEFTNGTVLKRVVIGR